MVTTKSLLMHKIEGKNSEERKASCCVDVSGDPTGGLRRLFMGDDCHAKGCGKKGNTPSLPKPRFILYFPDANCELEFR